ncbi:MAG TPA: VOC family protein [Longimicrobiaceae bacterium]|nr:VOC family protein [Longimicrobiaceae bacterium]
MRLDHAVILVPELGRAVEEYRSAGFTVTPGGIHSGGATRNALICLSDGTYLELLMFSRKMLPKLLAVLTRLRLSGLVRGGATPIEARFRERASGGYGLIDFAMSPESLDADLERLRREGVRVNGPLPGGRVSADGEPISWRLGLPAPRDLPFLCSDLTERSLRVPEGQAREHPNGARGIAALTVAVHSVEGSSARFQTLLGTEPDPGARERLRNARTRIFKNGDAELIVASPTSASSPIGRRLRWRGEGPHSIVLAVEPGADPLVISGSEIRKGPAAATEWG